MSEAAVNHSTSDPGRTIVLVLGMGRSGTSSLTRVLGLCGAAMPRTPLPPAKANNERGFWEPAPIVRAHDRILERLGTTWDGPAPRGVPVRDEWVEELAGLVEDQFGEARVLAVKDPRASRLVPLWKAVSERLGARLTVVIALRHPDEVARSLANREGYDREKSLRLWLGYTLSAERDTRDLPRVVVAYDRLLADWRGQVARANDALGLSLDAEAGAAGVAAFLDTALRHHHAGPEDLPDDATAVLAQMTALAEDRPADAAVLDEAWEAARAEEDRLRARSLRRISPSDGMPFTGERFVPSVSGEIEAEHVSRYLFAASLCAGRRVLDVACGEGYGAALLAQVASEVLGVDVDEQTVAHAERNYALAGLSFRVGSCERIPAADGSFDAVVSFETIEHIEDHAGFLKEVRRVLRPGGLFVCSTPDKSVYLAGQAENPYHRKELTGDQFDDLLRSHFRHTRTFGQRLVGGALIAPEGQAETGVVRTGDGRAYERLDATEGAVYRIVVCSDEQLPPVSAQALDDRRYSVGTVTSLLEARRRLEQEVATLSKRLGEMTTRAEVAEKHFAHLAVDAERLGASFERGLREALGVAEDRGRLRAERDAAVRDLEAARAERKRAAGELEHVRTGLQQAQEKLAATQAELRAATERIRDLQARADQLPQARQAAAEASTRAARLETRAQLAEQNASESARAAEHAARLAREAERELARLRATRSWRWTAPLRVVSAAGNAFGLRTLGLSARVLSRLGLPGGERLAVERRAALFRRSSLFDPDYYRATYPEIAIAGIDPAWHFAARGGVERRRPSEGFDTAWYLEAYPDVAKAGMHPFEHYITRGVIEGRRPMPPGASAGRPTAESPERPTARVEVAGPASMPPLAPVDPDKLARTKVLAFYLPQYHPIPENDAWWGKGFTEWSNVARARPMFPGHAQPMLPGDLGFYDLRLPEVRDRQAELARAAGIHGFCYYHYWFNGRRVLERPLNEVLASGSPKFPFCVCWANENWTRRWDGLEQEVLLRQQHTLASDRRFILDLIPCMEDERYVRVDGRPVVLVYRADLMVDAADTAAVWRDECLRAGLGEIHLCAVQFRTADPRPLGFDAAVEFPPHHFPAPEITAKVPDLDPAFRGVIHDYAAGVRAVIDKPRRPGYRLYRGVMPSWDNTARRMENAIVYRGATPELYEAWLRSAVNQPQPEGGPAENLVFINAWNEWAEGTVLEPRRDLGDAYLRATARVLLPHVPVASDGAEQASPDSVPPSAPVSDVSPQPEQRTIEDRIKRVVRTTPALNTFLNRHPGIKNKAAGVVRKMASSASASPAPPEPEAPVVVRGNRDLWHAGSKERVAPDATPILIVSHDACLAGAQIVALELLRHFAQDPSVRVYHLLCGSGRLEPEFRPLATTLCLDDLTRRGLSRAKAIEAALDAMPPVEAAICNTAAVPDAVAACARRGMRTVAYLHELPTTIDAMLGGEKTMRTIDRAADRIVVVSEFVRDRLCERYGLPPERPEVVHMGVFPSKSGVVDRDTARRKVAAELGVDPATPLVLGCGTIHPRKGTDLWVRAAARTLRVAREAAKPLPIFFWVGWDQTGPEARAWCEHDACAAGISEHVRFIGVREDTRPYFAAADVLALSSREDPFPLVNVEALASGTPVVAFAGAGGAPEAILDPEGDAGVVVRYADADAMGEAIAGLLADPALRQEAGRHALRIARDRLSWDRYVGSLTTALLPHAPLSHTAGV